MKNMKIHSFWHSFLNSELRCKLAKRSITIVVAILIFPIGFKNTEAQIAGLYSTIKPKVIKTDLPHKYDGMGGLIVADITGEGRMDFIITKKGHITAHRNSGEKLWHKQMSLQLSRKSERDGLPGLHAPGVQAVDVDGDYKAELLFLTKNNELVILSGLDGSIRSKLTLKQPMGSQRWEHLVVSNFRGKGDFDLLLQATNSEGYRMGIYLAAFAIDLLEGNLLLSLLWERDDFIPNAHSGARVADLDGDGKDEIVGGVIISPEGRRLTEIPLKGHVDSIFIADIRPDIFGLEVVALEEGGRHRIIKQQKSDMFRLVNRLVNRIYPVGNRVFLYNNEKFIWQTDFKHIEPQNASIGEFNTSLKGLEIWCRSRFDVHQKPFVFDAKGRVIANYELDDVAPEGWTIKGVEEISPIHWTGEAQQLLAAKERHKEGDVAIFDAISGKFLHRFKENANRLYVADVYGDWREELIVLNGNELRIYENRNPNPNSDRDSLWKKNYYRRSKMTWNYYNP
jgi:hypothetical protein